MLNEQRHAFCTSTRLSHAMADVCSKILQELPVSVHAQASIAMQPQA